MAKDRKSAGIKSATKSAGSAIEGAYRLTEGSIDPAREHIGITFGDDEKIVARIAPGQGKTFVVQYLAEPDLFSKEKGGMLDEVKRDLNFYLVEKGEENPWAYAKYHCTTAANIYSQVHWGWYPDKSVSTEEKQHHAMNKKRIFICPKCQSKFIVSGNVPFTCPECKKAELVPFGLPKNKQVEGIHKGDREPEEGR